MLTHGCVGSGAGREPPIRRVHHWPSDALDDALLESVLRDEAQLGVRLTSSVLWRGAGSADARVNGVKLGKARLLQAEVTEPSNLLKRCHLPLRQEAFWGVAPGPQSPRLSKVAVFGHHFAPGVCFVGPVIMQKVEHAVVACSVPQVALHHVK